MKKDYHFPSDRLYDSRENFWVRKEDSGDVTIGLDEYGLDQVGELAYLSLEPVGKPVRQYEVAGSVEAAKMTDELRLPLSGTITAVNNDAMKDPSVVNESPYDNGWLVRVRPDRWEEESAALMNAEDRSQWVQAESDSREPQGVAN